MMNKDRIFPSLHSEHVTASHQSILINHINLQYFKFGIYSTKLQDLNMDTNCQVLSTKQQVVESEKHHLDQCLLSYGSY